jgi:hypothetical protein
VFSFDQFDRRNSVHLSGKNYSSSRMSALPEFVARPFNSTSRPKIHEWRSQENRVGAEKNSPFVRIPVYFA